MVSPTADGRQLVNPAVALCLTGDSHLDFVIVSARGKVRSPLFPLMLTIFMSACFVRMVRTSGRVGTWNSKFHTCRKYDQVDGCVDSRIIADRFADHFSKAFSSNSAQRAAELQIQFTEMRRKYIGCPLTDDYFFDVELVGNALYRS